MNRVTAVAIEKIVICSRSKFGTNCLTMKKVKTQIIIITNATDRILLKILSYAGLRIKAFNFLNIIAYHLAKASTIIKPKVAKITEPKSTTP